MQIKVGIESFGPQECNYLDCFVEFDGSTARFAYTWEDRRFIYEGSERPEAPGVYNLACAKDEGEIVLYRIPGDDQIIAKFYIPGEGHGFWAIDLVE